MTSYGEKIVLVNSEYTGMVSDTGIWVDKKIIELLKVRINCYEEIAKQISGNSAGLTGVSVPAYYSETIAGFWDIAGLPWRITGNFQSADGEIPATLQFITGEGDEGLLGWYLSIENNRTFTFFLEPKNGAKTIYTRWGKTPEQGGIKINCTLYVNPGRTSAHEQNIIKNGIQPFSRADREGIDVSITSNGKIFEIRESPARHGRTLIFRGSAH
jgi:hypothetical protein